MKRASPRQQKIAAAYDADVWPLGPMRAAEPLLRALPLRPATAAFEYGCATGRLSRQVAERLDGDSRLLSVDPSPAMIELAEAARTATTSAAAAANAAAAAGDGDPGAATAAARAAGAVAKITFRAAELQPLPVDEKAYDLVFSNLALGDLAHPARALAELSRALRPGGSALVTLPMRGSWGEFLDLYRDVLREQGKRDALSALAAYESRLPDPQTAVRWFEAAGLAGVSLETERWELLFKSAREFFFAPIIEFFPLPIWKQIAGGHGDEMQDVFFFVKEAIETYFAGTVFPVTMVVGLLRGEKPRS
jgi:SAM-dependent methyltransferase